jgi:hypothetical protein
LKNITTVPKIDLRDKINFWQIINPLIDPSRGHKYGPLMRLFSLHWHKHIVCL